MSLTPSAATGANIRAEMARRQVSQADLAAVIGVNQSTFSKRLRGIIPFDINELTTIAHHLNVPLSELLPKEWVA